MRKRFLAILLALTMVLTLLPTVAFAAGGNLPFSDVKTSDSFYDDVRYVYEKGIFKGVGGGKFNPSASTTRSMLVTVLYNLEAAPSAPGTPFTDVPAGTWYTQPVAWANAKEIIAGKGDGKFAPNDVIVRQDVLVVLYQFAQYKGYDTSKTGSITGFSDAYKIGAYAEKAVSWAVGSGLISGSGMLDPTGPITRAELAAYTRRFLTANVDTTDPGDAGKFALRSDKNIVFLGNSAGTVYLYLDTKLKADTIPLSYTVNGSTKTINLHDDGINGDDIAGDGVFSVAIDANELNLSEDAEVIFTASYNGKTSNPATVKYYKPISEFAYKAMEVVDKGIETVLAQPEFTSKPVAEKVSAIEAVLKGFAKADQIQENSIKLNAEYETISFLYPDNIIGGVMYGDFKEKQNGSARGGDAAAAVYAGLDTAAPVFANAAAGSAGSALILNSFPEYESAPDSIAFRTDFYNSLKSEWDNAGLATTLNVHPTVADYKKLDQYNVACFSTHGSRLTLRDGSVYSAICLAEQQSYSKNKLYEEELKSHQIAKVNGCYWILPEFFTAQYDENELSDTFVFAECCQFMGEGQGSSSSNYDYTMADAITGRGAKACVGYHNSVFAVYAREMMRTYVNGLIQGETSQSAYNDAVTAWGSDHAQWFQTEYGYSLSQYYSQQGKSYDPNTHIAYPVHRGNGNATLVNSGLKNGGFEQYSTSTSAPSFWTCEGDVRTLTQLGSISPHGTTGSRMAILTTGIGAKGSASFGNGTEGSRLSQTFMVPANATEIVFNYNFVSEEPMEYVGSKYDDSFVVTASQGSTTFHDQTYASINTSDWISVDGVDFTGGDHTAFQTGWATATVNVAAYQGKVITLNFIIYDVGDQLYDSACLIDNVSVH